MKRGKCVNEKCSKRTIFTERICGCGKTIKYLCKCCGIMLDYSDYNEHKQKLMSIEILKMTESFIKISNIAYEGPENEREEYIDKSNNFFNVKKWLSYINMEEYYKVFMKTGYDRVDCIKMLDMYELGYMQVDRKHAEHILSCLKNIDDYIESLTEKKNDKESTIDSFIN
jgi:hypothetical protein